MEKDDELKGDGNSINYEKRFFDVRVGRFLSLDPLQKSFPWYTPYQFAGNTPIWAIDLDGAEEFVYQLKLVLSDNGKPVFAITHSHTNNNEWIPDFMEPEKYTLRGPDGKRIGNYGLVFESLEDLKSQVHGKTLSDMAELSERQFQDAMTKAHQLAQGLEAGQNDVEQIMSEQYIPDGIAEPDFNANSTNVPAPRGRVVIQNRKPTVSPLSPSIKTCPMTIPASAKVVPQQKTGYQQVKYNWTRGQYKYEARWHTRTPNAPINQKDTWVIMRTKPGSANGSVPKQQWILTKGNKSNKWVGKDVWDAAVKARQGGTATQSQEKLLESGHFKAE